MPSAISSDQIHNNDQPDNREEALEARIKLKNQLVSLYKDSHNPEPQHNQQLFQIELIQKQFLTYSDREG